MPRPGPAMLERRKPGISEVDGGIVKSNAKLSLNAYLL